MAILAQTDRELKNEGTLGRVRVALLRWAVARLQHATRIPDQDALAKRLLRNDVSIANVLIRVMLVLPNFPAAALVDDAAGDTALQSQVNTLVPELLSRNVLVVADPDAVG